MIATRVQKRKEPAGLLESETERVPVENLEKSNKKRSGDKKSKTNLDKDVEDFVELNESENDLPFRDVPELEAVPSDGPERDRRETRIEPGNTYPRTRPVRWLKT